MQPDLLPELPVFVFAPNAVGLLSLLLQIVLPLAVALVSNRVTSAGAKAMLLLGFSAVTTLVQSALQAALAEVHWEFIPIVMNLVINVGIAALAHFAIWKPTGAADRALEVGRK